ncbi:MAG: 30S ribosomal protein S4 [Armatimonadetes bacterium]|nr:30S ribosomal protein S4 [Armatimonadota bacterium]
MARYTGPVCRLCRREMMKLFLKGERCFTNKCAIERRNYPPGQHGPGRQKKMTQYGIQLREKQKLRRIYGVGERQFQTYYAKAASQPGVTGENFLRLLERRLDNVVHRLGFATSRSAARQLVSHGNVSVNGRKVDVPSYQIRPGEVVSVMERHQDNPFIIESVQKARIRTVPNWLELDSQKAEGRVLSLPSRAEIDTLVSEQLIVEYYSK